MMSLRTIDSGAFQYGLTMISLIFELRIGVWRSILADDRGMTQHDAVALDGLDLRGRDVDHHVAVAEEATHRAQAHEVGLQLANAHGSRHVERGEGVLAGHAVRRQAVPGLEGASSRHRHRCRRRKRCRHSAKGRPEIIRRRRRISTSDRPRELQLLGRRPTGQPPAPTICWYWVDGLLDMQHGLGAEDRQVRGNVRTLRRPASKALFQLPRRGRIVMISRRARGCARAGPATADAAIAARMPDRNARLVEVFIVS